MLFYPFVAGRKKVGAWSWRGMLAASYQVFTSVWGVYGVAPGVAVIVMV